MSEENKLSYDVWKKHLKTDKDMNNRWKSLTTLGENVTKQLKNALDSSSRADAMKKKRKAVEENIFNILNGTKERLSFKRRRKPVKDNDYNRDEYVIKCVNHASDYIFGKIKEEKGVINMHGESIDKYLQPVSDRIWALKIALKTSTIPETEPSRLSFESMQKDILDSDKFIRRGIVDGEMVDVVNGDYQDNNGNMQPYLGRYTDEDDE